MSPKDTRWAFFVPIRQLLSAFPQATTGQKVAIVGMSLVVVMLIVLGLPGIAAFPAWAVVLMFGGAIVFIFIIVGLLLFIEYKTTIPIQCRQVPEFPPHLHPVVQGLKEIRQDAWDQICKTVTKIRDDNIRANIFLLAKIKGGLADGSWMLIIHEDLAINMDDPVERQLQLKIGQGATGVAFRDGTHQLTRRQPSSKGQWDRKFRMTPELEAQIHRQLKWIVSFPLLKPNTNEAVGVLNIDGLEDVDDDDVLNSMATSVRKKVDVIAEYLSLQRSICVRKDQLGVMKYA